MQLALSSVFGEIKYIFPNFSEAVEGVKNYYKIRKNMLIILNGHHKTGF